MLLFFETRKIVIIDYNQFFLSFFFSSFNFVLFLFCLVCFSVGYFTGETVICTYSHQRIEEEKGRRDARSPLPADPKGPPYTNVSKKCLKMLFWSVFDQNI